MERVSDRTRQGSWIGWVATVLAVAVTAALAVYLVRSAPIQGPANGAGPAMKDGAGPSNPASIGVVGSLEAGGARASVRLTSAAFALQSDQALDPRLPPGPFSAAIDVTFDPGAVRRAAVGAELRGGSLVIERRGKAVLTEEALAAPRQVMSELLYLPGELFTLTYRFHANGAGPPLLRALWRPETTAVAIPLPATGTHPVTDQTIAGLSLVRQLRCAACHAAGDASLAALLTTPYAPYLGAVGARARPDWIRRWVGGPQSIKPGAAMPALFAGTADSADRIEDLTQYLSSLGGPLPDGAPADADLFETGRALYHSVGCFACHGAQGDASFALGSIGAKTTIDALAAFLADPVALRPDGRMPSQSLSGVEAEAIATWLVSLAESSAAPEPTFVVDPPRARRGETLFAESGCANCHVLGPGTPATASRLEAPSFDEVCAAVSGGVARGCLSESPPPGSADFGLDDSSRRTMEAFLQSVPQRRGHDAPLERLAADLDRLQCLACHTWAGAGGPDPGAQRLFTTRPDIDLGDEGRLPPDLADAGARLDPDWLRRVLQEHGVARPYMAVRMPQYGELAVSGLPALFAAAAGVERAADHGPAIDSASAAAGRVLSGINGFNCIQCHSIAGRSATDLPGPDLVQLPERLRHGYYSQWMHDPKGLRPTTRMPTFFLNGRSGLTEHFGGDAQKQIDAMWMYYSQGEHLPLPDGLPDPGRYLLSVGREPIVFRTFMTGVGSRAIACGFPEGVHCAFDAETCTLRLVWEGSFLNAAGAWAARGGYQTDPTPGPAWTAPPGPLFTTLDGEPARPRWRGYQLDADGRPIFLYDLESGSGAGSSVVHVEEQPVPAPGPALLRKFTFTAPEPFVLEGPQVVRGGPDGPVECTVEVTW